MPPTTYTVSAGYRLSGTTLISGTTSSTLTLSAGDTLVVASGGTAEALTVTGETVRVSSGATTSNLVISNGGTEAILVGAKAFNTSVSNGGVVTEAGNLPSDTGLYIGSGGLLDILGGTGSHTSPVTVASGAMIEFGGIAGTTSAGVVPVSVVRTASTTSFNVSAGNLAHEQIVLSGGGLTYTSSTVSTAGGIRDLLTITAATCFATGTQILTGTGEVAIETVQQGDTVVVMRNGESVLEPVIWVGRSRIDLARHARPEWAAPIRVKTGALADNTPARDLLLSPEHCLIIGGRCIPVKHLINGGSIAREYPAEPFEYFHLELENHGILIAEGAAAESYLDTGNRASFDNPDSPRMLHPTFAVNPSSERWRTDACAPLAVVPDEVAPVWEALVERSAALGHKFVLPATIEDPDLHLVADGQRIQPVSDRNARHVFVVPAGMQSVTLASRYCIPADKMIPNLRDARRLGVSVEWIAIRSSTDETILPADHPALRDGWNEVEQSGSKSWRWTDGAAAIPWENITGPTVVTVRCTPIGQYPLHAERTTLVA